MVNFNFNPRQFRVKRTSSRQWAKPFLRIGHSGAAAYSIPNTLESFALALETGVDMVEFDVRACRDGLVLAHNRQLPANAQLNTPHRRLTDLTVEQIQAVDLGNGSRIPTLSQAIDFIKGRALMNVDLKTPGYEAEVMDVLREKNSLSDVIISSTIPRSLRRIRGISSMVKTGISYPEDIWLPSPVGRYVRPLVKLFFQILHYAYPRRVLRVMAYAQANAVMLSRMVVSADVVKAVQESNGRVFVWTVDSLSTIRRLYKLGVDGVASNRPDLFRRL
jgi:glycerophosphoryl diester phosphodiesterase